MTDSILIRAVMRVRNIISPNTTKENVLAGVYTGAEKLISTLPEIVINNGTYNNIPANSVVKIRLLLVISDSYILSLLLKDPYFNNWVHTSLEYIFRNKCIEYNHEFTVAISNQ